jgi:hypothetical protein
MFNLNVTNYEARDRDVQGLAPTARLRLAGEEATAKARWAFERACAE